MSRKEVQKTVTVSYVMGAAVTVVDAAPHTVTLEPVKVYGEISDRKAMRVLRDRYPDFSNVVLLKVDREEITYSMSVEDFVKHGTPVNTSSED